MDKKGSPEKGFVLIYVILAIVLATLLASALYTSVFLTNKLFIQQQNNKLAYYVAVSGVEYASYIIKSGHYPAPTGAGNWVTTTWPYTSFDPTGGNPVGVSVTVTIASNGASPPVYTITSAAEYPGAAKTITVTCTSTGSATSWSTS